MQVSSPPTGKLKTESMQHRLVIADTPQHRAILAAAIRNKRTIDKINQYEFASLIGSSQPVISTWESEQRFPKDVHQSAIFNWLGWDEEKIRLEFGIPLDIGKGQVNASIVLLFIETLNNDDLFLILSKTGEMIKKRLLGSGKSDPKGAIISEENIYPKQGAKMDEYKYALKTRQRRKLQQLLIASSAALGWSIRSFAEGGDFRLIQEAIALPTSKTIEYTESSMLLLAEHCCRVLEWEGENPRIDPDSTYQGDLEAFWEAIRNSDSFVH